MNSDSLHTRRLQQLCQQVVSSQSHRHIVIAGATGLTGRAAVEHFCAKGWAVTCLSRRVPEYDLKGAQHIAIDLCDKDGCERAIRPIAGVTHAIYTAMNDSGLTSGSSGTMDEGVRINSTMLLNFVNPLLESNGNTLQHLSLMNGTGAYGSYTFIDKPHFPSRESMQDTVKRDKVDIFYWALQDIVRERQAGQAWTYTIWTPPLLIGWAVGVPLNVLSPIAAHAAIMRELGQPLCFPGPAWGAVQECIDTRLLARAFEWASDAPGARNKSFNLTNGDVYLWENLYKVVARVFNMEMGPPKEVRLAKEMPQYGELWSKIVKKYDLRPLTLDELLGSSCNFFDGLAMRSNTKAVDAKNSGVDWGRTAPVGHLSNCIPIRKAGFHEYQDTEEMLEEWLRRLQEERYIPK